MSERDYVIEKNRLTESLGKVNDRLDKLNDGLSSQFSISDEELLAKASYFIMSQKAARQALRGLQAPLEGDRPPNPQGIYQLGKLQLLYKKRPESSP